MSHSVHSLIYLEQNLYFACTDPSLKRHVIPMSIRAFQQKEKDKTVLTGLRGRLGDPPRRQSCLKRWRSRLLHIFLSLRCPDAWWDLWNLVFLHVLSGHLGGRRAVGDRFTEQVDSGSESRRVLRQHGNLRWGENSARRRVILYIHGTERFSFPVSTPLKCICIGQEMQLLAGTLYS